MSEAKIENEPVIADEPVVKKEKLSTLKFKIQPELPYFPGDKIQAQKIKKLYNEFKFEEAQKEEIKDE